MNGGVELKIKIRCYERCRSEVPLAILSFASQATEIFKSLQMKISKSTCTRRHPNYQKRVLFHAEPGIISLRKARVVLESRSGGGGGGGVLVGLKARSLQSIVTVTSPLCVRSCESVCTQRARVCVLCTRE